MHRGLLVIYTDAYMSVGVTRIFILTDLAFRFRCGKPVLILCAWSFVGGLCCRIAVYCSCVILIKIILCVIYDRVGAAG